MNVIRAISSFLLLSPFIIIGVFMHFCMIGMQIATPFMAILFKPSNMPPPDTHVVKKVITATREEFEEFEREFKKDNPSASEQQIATAFIRTRGDF